MRTPPGPVPPLQLQVLPLPTAHAIPGVEHGFAPPVTEEPHSPVLELLPQVSDGSGAFPGRAGDAEDQHGQGEGMGEVKGDLRKHFHGTFLHHRSGLEPRGGESTKGPRCCRAWTSRDASSVTGADEVSSINSFDTCNSPMDVRSVTWIVSGSNWVSSGPIVKGNSRVVPQLHEDRIPTIFTGCEVMFLSRNVAIGSSPARASPQNSFVRSAIRILPWKI